MTEKPAKEKTELLYDLLRDATRRADVSGVFFVLFRGAKEGAGISDGVVLQFNPEKGSLEVKAKTPGKFREAKELFMLSRPSVEEIAGIREAVVRTDAKDMFFQGSKSQFVSSVAVDSRENGLVVFESGNPDHFDEPRVSFVKEMLEQTAAVIKMKSAVESSNQELSCLWDVKRKILSPEELDVSELNTMLGKILQLALARTKSSNGVILLADEKTGELVISSHAVMGNLAVEPPEKLSRHQRGRPSGIVFRVLDSNKPYMSGNIENDPNYIPLFKGIKSHLSVPISFQDRCIGVIVVESMEPNAYTQQSQLALEELSKSITTLVRRAQLYEATKDAMAGAGGRGVIIRGLSPEWEEVERRVERAADTTATVILRGESGTGKELVAHAIHFNSKRKDKKLVVVNSAAIPDQLLESALFGHVKGAFTGATYDRVGEFEKADGGSIFLDEMGELSLPLQAKMLRVLQSGEIQKVGSNEDSKRVDVRVIAATSRNLEDMMSSGQFREDLYYRLHVVPIWLPALRQYKNSIPGMIKAFILEASKEHERSVSGISNDALELMTKHDYPGNVRELRNIIEQAVIMARGEKITCDDLPKILVENLKTQASKPLAKDYKNRKKEILDEFEEKYITSVLGEVRGNISKAAEISGMNRVNFYKLIRRHKVDPKSYK
jgi:transcriptional regulator with GAF, ATPase, and Fis domain